MSKHKHAELIKQWADGAKVQLKRHDGWIDVQEPTWVRGCEYRVKPAEEVVRWLWSFRLTGTGWSQCSTYMTAQEADEYFNSEADYKKLEWSGRLIGGACAPCRDRYKLA